MNSALSSGRCFFGRRSQCTLSNAFGLRPALCITTRFHLAAPTLNQARTVVVLERLAREIAERVRPVCAHLSETELLALASGMAVIELKFLHRASTTICERRRPSVAQLMEQRRLNEPDPP